MSTAEPIRMSFSHEGRSWLVRQGIKLFGDGLDDAVRWTIQGGSAPGGVIEGRIEFGRFSHGEPYARLVVWSDAWEVPHLLMPILDALRDAAESSETGAPDVCAALARRGFVDDTMVEPPASDEGY